MIISLYPYNITNKKVIIYIILFIHIFYFNFSIASINSNFSNNHISTNNTKYNDEKKKKFKTSFDNHCNKYPFVSKWKNMIESRSSKEDKFFIFVYQEDGSKTGGMGDRFAGIVSAVALSIRF